MSMIDLIKRGIENRIDRDEQIKQDKRITKRELNMRAPEDPRKRQKVILIDGIEQRALRGIFKAFNINEEILVDMSIT